MLQGDIQFLARMIVATREGQQISSSEAKRLSDLAEFGIQVGGPGDSLTTMPEERRGGDKPISGEPATSELVGG